MLPPLIFSERICNINEAVENRRGSVARDEWAPVRLLSRSNDVVTFAESLSSGVPPIVCAFCTVCEQVATPEGIAPKHTSQQFVLFIFIRERNSLSRGETQEWGCFATVKPALAKPHGIINGKVPETSCKAGGHFGPIFRENRSEQPRCDSFRELPVDYRTVVFEQFKALTICHMACSFQK